MRRRSIEEFESALSIVESADGIQPHYGVKQTAGDSPIHTRFDLGDVVSDRARADCYAAAEAM